MRRAGEGDCQHRRLGGDQENTRSSEAKGPSKRAQPVACEPGTARRPIPLTPCLADTRTPSWFFTPRASFLKEVAGWRWATAMDMARKRRQNARISRPAGRGPARYRRDSGVDAGPALVNYPLTSAEMGVYASYTLI